MLRRKPFFSGARCSPTLDALSYLTKEDASNKQQTTQWQFHALIPFQIASQRRAFRITRFSNEMHKHHDRVINSDSNDASPSDCRSLLGVSPRANMSLYLKEICYRSSYARELLRERIKEPSVEIALKELEDFCVMRRPHSSADRVSKQCPIFTEAEMNELLTTDDVGKIELLLGHFERWYFAMRAPEKVKMFEPWTWFPKARQMKRRFIFHAGPTNSGKTHAALEQLMSAKSGVYCAPLKALAAQVYHKIDKRVPCDLLIGDERRFGGSAEHVSCTMEMTPADFMVDVGVIDEIQMISDRERGWAWSRALLGLPAKEIHLCGEERAVEVVRNLLRCTREDYSLKVVKHNRLVGLSLSPPLGGNYGLVENGDCVVAFGKNKIFEIKSEIERSHPNAVVNVIYGGLPFSVRESESEAFNEGVKRCVLHKGEDSSTGAEGKTEAKEEPRIGERILSRISHSNGVSSPPPPHVLVTTDAIAYGLNMNIRRIIFSTMRKFDGKGMIDLPQSTVLQVGGRAGRYGMVFSSRPASKREGGTIGGGGGLVTTVFNNDLRKVEEAFASPLPMIPQAGLLPTAEILTLFAEMKYGAAAAAAAAGGGGTTQTSAASKIKTVECSSENISTPTAAVVGSPVSFAQLLSDFIASMEKENERGHGRNLFFPCDMTRSVLAIANALDSVGSSSTSSLSVSADAAPFSIKDRIVFCFCPLSDAQPASYEVLRSYAIDHCNIMAKYEADKTKKDSEFFRENENNDRGIGREGSDSNEKSDTCNKSGVRLIVDERLEEILRERPVTAFTFQLTKKTCTGNGETTDNTTMNESAKTADTSSLTLRHVYEDLGTLEWIYRMGEVYGWLSWRFPLSFIGGQDASQSLKERCSEAIRERLALLPRSHVPPFVLEREARNAQTSRRGYSGDRRQGSNSYGQGQQERLVFEPRPLTDRGAAPDSDDDHHQQGYNNTRGGSSNTYNRKSNGSNNNNNNNNNTGNNNNNNNNNYSSSSSNNNNIRRGGNGSDREPLIQRRGNGYYKNDKHRLRQADKQRQPRPDEHHKDTNKGNRGASFSSERQYTSLRGQAPTSPAGYDGEDF